MKRFFFFFWMFLLSYYACLAAGTTASPEGWETHLETGIGLTQAAYSDNWAGGEVGSIIWAANLHATAQKQLSSKFRHENDLKLAFGQTHSQDQMTQKWVAPVKSTDKIRFDSILKLTLNTWVDPYIAAVFESQFYDASVPTIKRYINPIDLTESAGASRTLFDNASGKATTRLGFGLRQKINRTVSDTSQNATTTETSLDGGVEWVTDWTANLAKTLTYTTKLTVFQAFFYSEADELKGLPQENYWKAVDLDWDNILTANVTKIVQVSLAWQLLYDKEVSEGGRFKETLALGIAWLL